jgi:hypothetical protein
MLHAARASAPRAAAPPSPRQFLIDTSAIKIARNSPENNTLNFSNRSKIASLPAPLAHVLHSKNHDSPVTYHRSRFTNHQSLLTSHAFLIATFSGLSRRRSARRGKIADGETDDAGNYCERVEGQNGAASGGLTMCGVGRYNHCFAGEQNARRRSAWSFVVRLPGARCHGRASYTPP